MEWIGSSVQSCSEPFFRSSKNEITKLMQSTAKSTAKMTKSIGMTKMKLVEYGGHTRFHYVKAKPGASILHQLRGLQLFA